MTIKIKTQKSVLFVLAVVVTGLLFLFQTKDQEWRMNGGGSDNTKYSTLNQIDSTNVHQLKVAWIYHSEKQDTSRFGVMECNPIMIDRVLYGVSPRLKLFALDAATGIPKWEFDPADSLQNKTWVRNSVNMNRGVTYWREGNDQRIIYSAGPIVFEVDALTGRLVKSFGRDGGIDLREGLDRDPKQMSVSPTSPVLIYKDLFVVSGAVNETTPGHIRAYDIKTGKQRWIFHTVPYPGEPGYETWKDRTAYKRMGSANAWSGFTLDAARGILFAGIGNPTSDFYGGDRLGNGLYGNCIVALDAASGKLKWHFQAVHHDVWDMDISSPPALITLSRNGKKTDALVQTMKTGFIFVFDRETGQPLFPIEERPVPTRQAVASESVSPTQPFPVLPKPFVRTYLGDKDLNRLMGDSSYREVRHRLHQYFSEGIFTPPSEKGTIILPGYDGGANWGGPAVDPETNILYINANEMAWVLNLVKDATGGKKAMSNLEAGALLYNRNCMGCHGPERMGSGDYPSLLAAKKKYSHTQFTELLQTGRRMMPGFGQLSNAEKNALAAFVLENKTEQAQPYTGQAVNQTEQAGPAYTHTGYNKFLNREGYPAISPPWGSINAINLNTGKLEWKIPFGEYKELKKKGIPTTGRESFGAPVVTAGGLLFIGASADGKFRAISKRTGKIIWEFTLPAPATATPAVYAIKGKEYIVVACGGAKSGGKMSDTYIAFALPD